MICMSIIRMSRSSMRLIQTSRYVFMRALRPACRCW